MQIEFTNEQYRKMLELVSLGNGVLGILGDASGEEDYKSKSDEGEELQSYLLGFANEFDSEDLLGEEMYRDHILPILMDYEDYATYDNLVTQLSWRDMHREMSDEELDELIEKYEDQFEKKIGDYEEKYQKEFNEFGLNRLEIVYNEESTEAQQEEGEVKEEEWVEEENGGQEAEEKPAE